MSDDVYTDEPVIGHHVQAELEERTPSTVLQDLSEKTGVPLRDRPDFVRITEGDVNWDKTKELKINVDQLREMALQFTDLEEPCSAE